MNDLTRKVMETDDAYVMHTYGRFPVVLEKGRGVYVTDTEGKTYLDMVAGIAVNMLGYGDEALAEAIASQARSLMHTSNLYYSIPQGKLAEKLVRASGLKRVFFCNSGAEANEAALKLARKAAKRSGNPDKIRIVAALNSFHGRTMGAITATGQEKYRKNFTPLVPGFDYVEYNNTEQLEKAVGPDTCAVILEPIQGESGVRPAEKQYLQAARRLCTDNNAALILDEVQTGMGRTGKMFAFEHFGIKPDVLTMAKMLGGGFPIGACAAGEGFDDVLVPGDHASTFGGNPLACAAALEVLRRMEEDRLVENSAETGAFLKQALSGLPQVDEVRGLGLMIGVGLRL
ncbi:MAG: aspartate aminotransferase family protein, partial [Abditibacteriota bacterium]|nr:aspartate aminotransferase family protein [Abditibacteriota bacterium]